jgi:hypothetical protein
MNIHNSFIVFDVSQLAGKCGTNMESKNARGRKRKIVEKSLDVI